MAGFKSLPAELRIRIYGLAAERGFGTEYVLKAWLDKINGHTNDDEEEEWNSSTSSDDDDHEDQEAAEDAEDAEDAHNHADEAVEGDPNAHLTVGPTLPAAFREDLVETRVTPFRHTVGLLGVTAHPPPTALILAFGREVKQLYNDTTALYININKDLRYITFFEDTLDQFSSLTAFSPIEQMRHLNLNLHWSTNWLDNHQDLREIHEAMFLLRVEQVANLVATSMPALTRINIKYYDRNTVAGPNITLQRSVLTRFWDTVGYDRKEKLGETFQAFFTQPGEPTDPGVLALESDFNDMVGESNGGWV
ncbi:MAG: hypothetical protein M1821_003767 [Bathelium mastoideum]|nr:MAG: hypothetical protein M1821_003767 [Bathelium mastoideum]